MAVSVPTAIKRLSCANHPTPPHPSLFLFFDFLSALLLLCSQAAHTTSRLPSVSKLNSLCPEERPGCRLSLSASVLARKQEDRASHLQIKAKKKKKKSFPSTSPVLKIMTLKEWQKTMSNGIWRSRFAAPAFSLRAQ